MLVLSRRSTESIRIGDNIVVSVIDVHGNRVRLGISAPQQISVLRTELGAPKLPESKEQLPGTRKK